MKPLITVIVPVYNVEEHLDRCIESIINQTYKNLEIILVNDGSPDNCPALCDKWAEKDDRIRVIHKTNGGVSSARNSGINVAKGEYVGFVDSDDYISADMYELMVESIINNNSELSVIGYKIEEKEFRHSDELISNEKATVYMFDVKNCEFFQGYSCNKLYMLNVIKHNN